MRERARDLLRRSSSWVAPALWVVLTLLLLVVIGPASADVTYQYDELGRLIAVVDPTGETATYTYDAVGNLLSISRQSSSQVSIIDFTPKSGPIGTSVTISGTGFSATPSQNTVTFNGVAAVVASATSTQIVTNVPTGATTGPITVSTPTGSATSSTPFTVTVTTSGQPTITGFTPTIGSPGTAVTITGTNFEAAPPSNDVRFNGGARAAVSAATATTLSASVPAGATSGRISVTTPAGRAESTGDFVVPPAPYGPADVEVVVRMALGETKTVTITTPNKIALILFDATAGQQASMNISGATFPTGASLTVKKPDGKGMLGIGGNINSFQNLRFLPLTGTYTIVIDPTGTDTGSVTVTLYNLVDATATITPGGPPVTITTTTPGQNAVAIFSGTAGQRVSAHVSHFGGSEASIYGPDGTILGVPTGSSFVDVVTLPVTGTYSVRVVPVVATTGSVTFTLYDVPPDPTSPITIGGPSVTLTTTTPGQNARLTFSGTAGQRISLLVNMSLSRVTIFNPDGTTLVTREGFGTEQFIDTQTLPATGTYTIVIDPEGELTASMTSTLYNVPPDVTGSLSVGGAAVAVTISAPGQNARLTFSGNRNRQITVRVTNNTLFVNVMLLKPDGTFLTSTSSGLSSFNLPTQTLPVSGTYTITIDPGGTSTGSLSIQVTSP